MDSIDEILPGLFIGNVYASQNESLLETNHITHILNCTSDLENSFPHRFTYLRFGIIDDPDANLIDHLDNITDQAIKILDEGGRIFTHWYSPHSVYGMSRSATVVSAIVMKKNRTNFSDALKYVKERHPKTSPDSGLKDSLRSFQRFLKI